MLPDNFLADVVAGFFNTVANALFNFFLIPFTAVSNYVASWVAGLFPTP